MQISLTATTKDGQSIEALNKIIQRRAAVMHETTQKSVIAIAIQTMKSLRADTKKSNGKVKGIKEADSATSDFDISYKLYPEYKVGFCRQKGSKPVPCIRQGNKIVTDKKFWWRTGRGEAVYRSHVYRVIISSSRHEAWKKPVESWIVAPDIESVKKALEWRFSFIVKKNSVLGKSAWSRAMALTSDKPSNLENKNKGEVLQSSIKVTKLLIQQFNQFEGRFSITISDKLRFADKALKNGLLSVSLAMAKAVNSTNAIVNKYIQKHKDDLWDSTADIETWERIFPNSWFNNEGE